MWLNSEGNIQTEFYFFTKEVSLAGTLLFPDLFLLTYFTIFFFFFYLWGAPYWCLGTSPYLLHPSLAQQPSFTTFLNILCELHLLLLPSSSTFFMRYNIHTASSVHVQSTSKLNLCHSPGFLDLEFRVHL